MKLLNRFLQLFTAAFLLFSSTVFGQSGKSAVEFTGGFGSIIRNHPDVPDINSDAYSLTLGWSRHLNGYKPWHRFYNFPEMGISLTQGIPVRDDIFSGFTGLMAEMTFVKNIGNSFYWGPRLSLGSAWFYKPYNESKNEGTVLIGSDFTFLASADIVLGYKATPALSITGRLSLLHASNSHFTLPNVGMNLPLFALGVKYSYNNKLPAPEQQVTLPEFKKVRLNFRVALGVNESGGSTGPVDGPKYPVYLASLTASRMFSPVNKISAGIEGWYNKGVYNYIVSQDFYQDNRYMKSVSIAAVLSHEFLMGKFGIYTSGGIYLYNPFYNDRIKEDEIDDLKTKLKGIIPARIGVQYHLKNTHFNDRNNFFAGIYIKTNFGQADFLESGIGYIF